LPYDYNALEPVLDEATMKLHHTKHHQAYVDKLNAALDKHPELKDKDLADLLTDLNQVPEDIRQAVRNNGGGHLNHSFFWEGLAPVGSEATVMLENLVNKIDQDFGSLEVFKEAFKTEGLNRFGSGWVWLVIGENNKFQIVSTANQDTPLGLGLRPILAVDLWEHAYYLKYQNRRAEYLDNIWQIVNWKKVAELAPPGRGEL